MSCDGGCMLGGGKQERNKVIKNNNNHVNKNIIDNISNYVRKSNNQKTGGRKQEKENAIYQQGYIDGMKYFIQQLKLKK
jgi:iron only hydrogenase large subunit-like protein